MAFAATASGEEASTLGTRAIHGPTTITRSGAYVLDRNFALEEEGPAIVIAAADVTLDLAGHTVSGPGGKQGAGIRIEGVNGIRVRNGSIARFGFGIQVVNAHDVRLEDLQIRGEDGGGPPPGEVGILVLNSRAVVVERNTVSRTFLGVFVRGGGSGGNRIGLNTLTGGQNGQIGICYNPDGSGSPAGPAGDLVYNNLVSRFRTGIQTSAGTAGNIFRENSIAYVQQAIQQITPGQNVFEGNASIQIGL